MENLTARRAMVVFALLCGSTSALAQAGGVAPSVPARIDSMSGAQRLALAATAQSAAADSVTIASLLAPASLSLSAATLSLTRQPEANDEPTRAASAEMTPAAGEREPASGEDKSGTDPTKLLASFGIRNEYRRLTDDNSYNVTTGQYGSPLGRPDMSLRLRVPFVATDVLGDGDVGLGDIALRYNWRAYLDKTQGLLLGAELAADTASKDILGRGKWTIAPSITYAMFLSKNVIFAPAFQQTLSFAGDENRANINESAFDLYMVFRADDAKSWLIVDPTLGIDWENEENTPLTLEVEYGRNIGTLFGGALNAFIRPGVGIGQDRPYDWNIEVGFTVVGF